MSEIGTYKRTVEELKNTSTERALSIDKTTTHHIEYGKIIGVDFETSRVRVERQNGQELRGATIDGKPSQRFFPLLTPMTTIHMLYGPLIEGLKVRIHWIGNLEPESLIVVDIITNESSLVSQDYKNVDLARGFSMPI